MSPPLEAAFASELRAIKDPKERQQRLDQRLEELEKVRDPMLRFVIDVIWTHDIYPDFLVCLYSLNTDSELAYVNSVLHPPPARTRSRLRR